MTDAERAALVERMATAMAEMSGLLQWNEINDWGKGIWRRRAIAALAVAEPVIREDEQDAIENLVSEECEDHPVALSKPEVQHANGILTRLILAIRAKPPTR